jgi:predicted dienelactone hydrolase
MRGAVALFALSACIAEPDEPTPLPEVAAWSAPDTEGPYSVGARTHEFVDARGIEMIVELWYPALPAEGAVPEDYGQLSVVRNAFRDAPIDARNQAFPLIAFSHGFGGIRYQSTFLTEHLASHGFVVVAPDHPNNTLFDLDSDITDLVALARPGDISAAVDEVARLAEDGAEWEGVVDATRFGMAGHSFGGWTTLAVGGGVVDLEATAAYCEATPTASCDFLDLSALTEVGDTSPDSRVVASAALAPGGAFTFVEGSLETVENVLVMGGQRDGDMPYDSEIRPAFDRLGSGATLVTLARSGHWAFTDLCELLDVFDDCQGEDSDYMDAEVVQATTNTLVTAHLRSTMLGSTDDEPFLADSYWQDTADVTVMVTP